MQSTLVNVIRNKIVLKLNHIIAIMNFLSIVKLVIAMTFTHRRSTFTQRRSTFTLASVFSLHLFRDGRVSHNLANEKGEVPSREEGKNNVLIESLSVRSRVNFHKT